ncbi:MAG: DUF1501 domain-containing protein [Planctomycetaceae bacterium]|nr:DUF1501 domain-containing protein [Planctomycetaceae bacterium]
MFKVSGGATRDCEGLVRRSFVQAGVLGLAGLALPEFLQLKAQAAPNTLHPRPPVTRNDTSVILIWMSGGPGHHETWDPKPDAVSQYRGPFGATATSVPGMQFSELCPEQAKIAEHLAVLRGVRHGSGDHTKGNHWMLTGFEGPDFNKPDNKIQRRPSLGSAAAALRGPVIPGMPPYAAAPHLRGGTDNLFHYAAYLGGAHNPFITNSDPNEADFRVRNLALMSGLTFDRLESRRELLKTIDEVHRRAEPQIQSVNEHQAAAFDLLTSATVKDAFDISSEPDSIRDAYGRHTFGQSALLARRLVERGVTFVTVNTQPWDHHGTANRLPTAEGANLLIPPTDKAIAALVRDLIDRGLDKKTLVVAMGEFGRTPKMNDAGGRDHWGHAFSVLFACGGMNMGQAIGSSDAHGAYVTERPIDPEDVAATVYHHLGINARQTTINDLSGRPRYLVEKGEPIRELVGEIA